MERTTATPLSPGDYVRLTGDRGADLGRTTVEGHYTGRVELSAHHVYVEIRTGVAQTTQVDWDTVDSVEIDEEKSIIVQNGGL